MLLGGFVGVEGNRHELLDSRLNIVFVHVVKVVLVELRGRELFALLNDRFCDLLEVKLLAFDLLFPSQSLQVGRLLQEQVFKQVVAHLTFSLAVSGGKLVHDLLVSLLSQLRVDLLVTDPLFQLFVTLGLLLLVSPAHFLDQMTLSD